MSDLRDTELRGNIPRRLMELLDAVAHAKGLNRFDWLIPVLEKECAREVHEATLLLRMARINPLDSERNAD